MQAINEICRAKGGGYSCKTVSWDDASRGTVGGGLGCWGSNITDTYLKARDGTKLFTVRPDNWNEKLGKISTAEVALVTGNQARAGDTPLQPITLRDFLRNAGEHGGYAGIPTGADLSKEALDTECSIRFQTTFLPVDEDAAGRATMEFATEAYNYNTRDDADPRNLLLLCTTQGVAVQQDGAGAKRLHHHAVDQDGVVHKYWLEAEQSAHQVGGAQEESAEEKEDALARGKATASVIGTKGMGTRFNVLMTIQLPLQQRPRPKPLRRNVFKSAGGYADASASYDAELDMVSKIASIMEMTQSMCCDTLQCSASDLELQSAAFMKQAGGKKVKKGKKKMAGGSKAKVKKLSLVMVTAAPAVELGPEVEQQEPEPERGMGKANAARVSRGTEVGTWSGLAVKAPQRNDTEHVTITCVIYNTVAGGVPSRADIVAAIDDMEQLYASCAASGKLADTTFEFMKSELTVAQAGGIATKLATQPYTPPPMEVMAAEVFPVTAGGA